MNFKNTIAFRLIVLMVRPFQLLYYYLYAANHRRLLEIRVKRANRLSKLENRTYLVYNMFGRPVCKSKQEVKGLIKRRRFKKGVSMEDIVNQAYYVVVPGKQTGRPEAVKIGNHKR